MQNENICSIKMKAWPQQLQPGDIVQNDSGQRAIVLRVRKRARTVIGLQNITVRTEAGEKFDSLNGCWSRVQDISQADKSSAPSTVLAHSRRCRPNPEPRSVVKVTDRTIMPIEASLSFLTIERLEQICRNGLPDPLTTELREAIEELVCKAINPLRPLPPLG